MSRSIRPGGLLAIAAALAAAGCGTASPAAPGQPAAAARPGGFLNTTLTTAAGSWAVVVMGGSAAQHNNFWQLFTRPAASARWQLITPPGTADNGGLIVAGTGQQLVTAVRPSQYLTFTPLARTTTSGRAWSALSPLDAPLAGFPDALAVTPQGTSLLALLTNGTATMAAGPGFASWKTLVTERALAATAAGRRCGLRALTAAAFTQAGTPLLAGSCSRPGTTGIFTDVRGTWRAAGPPVPVALAGEPMTVRRLTEVAGRLVVLLAAGSGHNARLLVGWSANGGGRWTLGPPLSLGEAALATASLGTAGVVAVTLTDGRGATVVPGRAWQAVPRLPPDTVTLAAGADGGLTAFAVARGTLTIWQARPEAVRWARAQVIRVPIVYGSSG